MLRWSNATSVEWEVGDRKSEGERANLEGRRWSEGGCGITVKGWSIDRVRAYDVHCRVSSKSAQDCISLDNKV